MQGMDRRKYTLGLDLGSSSLGWALVELDASDHPLHVLNAGARIFDPGVVGGDTQIEQGKDHSKASERRFARQQRKQTYRRALRQKKLFRLLQDAGLLPTGEQNTSEAFSEQRHKILNDLDKELASRWRGRAKVPGSTLDLADQSLVYLLRSIAVESRLEPDEIGRILYHLSQRRGYLSNGLDEEETAEAESEEVAIPKALTRNQKKQKEAEDKKQGEVAKGISDLRAKMDTAGTRYVGSYFALVNPHEERIRHRWTERAMFKEEFAAIWSKQREFYPERLTDELEAKVRYWLFFQRPLASAKHLIGFCELEKKERRAPWATLEAQRFRLLQRVNDLRVIERGGGIERSLRKEERERILDHLQNKGDLTFKSMKALLGSPEIEGFNLERLVKDRIEGNRVNVHMLRVFGDQWNALSNEDKHKAVEQWRTIRPEKLEQVGREQWGLDEFAAKRWGDTKLSRPPKDYCNLSRKALLELLPLMEDRVPFKTAEREKYGKRFSGTEPFDFVPRVVDFLPSITNPAVLRALTELRKVVNAIVREHGRPYQIRIELARELRRNRRDRAALFNDNQNRMKKREDGARWILAQQNKLNPSPQELRDVPHYMIEKWLLAEECRWLCPYTNETINYTNLFTYPVFEVEHIIPLSRCTDNSFANKTLCHRSANQNKGGKTPWEAYHSKEELWAQIRDRVSRFTGGPRIGKHPKLRRFELRSLEEIEGFTSRQLNDTRYTSKLAARLLMSLYGGRDTEVFPEANSDTAEFFDKTGRRIFASTGGVTKLLRDAWHLHPDVVLQLPSEKDSERRKGKDRSDHRHHAVDALVIALTTEQQVRDISLHAQSNMGNKWPLDYRDLVRGLLSPWTNREEFLGDVFPRMSVSHKPEHKLSGSLHKAGIYGKTRDYTAAGKPIVHERIPISDKLTSSDINSIVDQNVRNAVRLMEQTIGGFKKWSTDKHGYPLLKTKNGGAIPIKKIRIKSTNGGSIIGAKRAGDFNEPSRELINARRVDASEKHHVALFVSRKEVGKEKKLREKWVSESVSLFEAHCRYSAGQSIIRKQLQKDPEANFLYSLRKGDTVKLTQGGQEGYYILTAIEADGRINFVPINAAGKRTEQGNVKIREMADGLRLLKLEKVYIDLLGVPHPVHESSL